MMTVKTVFFYCSVHTLAIIARLTEKIYSFLLENKKYLHLFIKLIFRADLDANAAYAASADILKMLFHIFGAFFGVDIALVVAVWYFPENRARGTRFARAGRSKRLQGGLGCRIRWIGISRFSRRSPSPKAQPPFYAAQRRDRGCFCLGFGSPQSGMRKSPNSRFFALSGRKWYPATRLPRGSAENKQRRGRFRLFLRLRPRASRQSKRRAKAWGQAAWAGCQTRKSRRYPRQARAQRLLILFEYFA